MRFGLIVAQYSSSATSTRPGRRWHAPSMNHNNPISAGPHAADGTLPFPSMYGPFQYLFGEMMSTGNLVVSRRSSLCLVDRRTYHLFPSYLSSPPFYASTNLHHLHRHRSPKSIRRLAYRRRVFYLALGRKGNNGLSGLALRVTHRGRQNERCNC